MEQTNSSRSRRQTRSSIDFFRGFLRSPEQVGSIIPSSRFLERRLVNVSGLDTARVVVELGPGTGGTTRAILRAMPADARLLTVEVDPQFSSILEGIGDPRLIAHTGSATELPDILRHHGLDAPDVVISGIPFSTMPENIGSAIIEAIGNSLAPNGRFVAYQFRGRVGQLGRPILGDPDVQMELLNIPPMRFYTWRLNGTSSGRGGQVENRAGN